MDAGQLRHRIKIVDLSARSLNSEREAVPDPSVFAERWARIQPLSGREYGQGKATVAETTHSVQMRYLSGVKPQMQVLFGSRKFEIVEVRNIDERNTELDLICKELIT